MISKNPYKQSDPERPDRRRYIRIKKNFILTYHDKACPQRKYEITQLKNLSLGGMCLVTTQAYEPNTKLCLDMKTPFIADKVSFSGTVLESHKKVTNILYETRLAFDALDQEQKFLLSRIIEIFQKEENIPDD